MEDAIKYLTKRGIEIENRIAQLKTDKNYRKITNVADRFGMIRESEAIRMVIEILNEAIVSEDKVCDLCKGTGEYSFGGSFGGSVQTSRCPCSIT